MSVLENILDGKEKDFRYYSSKGHTSTPLEFGQKSIPYGRDEQGGGSSKQPYIQKTQGRLSYSIEELTNGLIDLSKQESATVDISRMTKWFTQPLSHGILFNAKQVHQSNQQEKNYYYSIGAGLNSNPLGIFKTAISSLVKNVGRGITNTGHILRQVGGNALNLHFNNPLTDKYRLLEREIGETGNVSNKGFRQTKEILGRSNYGEFNRIDTYKQGNPGQTRLDRTSPFGTKSSPNKGITLPGGEEIKGDASNAPTVDKITYKKIYQTDSGEVDNSLATSDMVPFYITVLDNDDISKNKHIHFRAFIDNFSDNFSSNWVNHKFMGRGEDFFTYGGYSRDINLSFKVHAQSKQELMPMYEKLNYLASVMAPDYNPTSGHMRGNLIRLTIGDYIVNTAGVLTGFAMSIPNEYPWDIGRDKEGIKIGNALPTIIDIGTFNFKPIEDFIPKVGERFINNNTIIGKEKSLENKLQNQSQQFTAFGNFQQ